MNIEELRKAAENKDGWVNYLHEQDFAPEGDAEKGD